VDPDAGTLLLVVVVVVVVVVVLDRGLEAAADDDETAEPRTSEFWYAALAAGGADAAGMEPVRDGLVGMEAAGFEGAEAAGGAVCCEACDTRWPG